MSWIDSMNAAPSKLAGLQPGDGRQASRVADEEARVAQPAMPPLRGGDELRRCIDRP